MNDEQEFLKAFRGEQDDSEVADSTNDAEVSDTAAEGEGSTPTVAVVIDAGDAVDGGDAPAELTEEPEPMDNGDVEPAPGEVPPGDVAAEAATEGEPVAEEAAEMGAELSPEELQRQKSWEGRLKKREEELAAREAAMSQAPVQAESVSDEEIEGIRSRLADDFGEDFVSMIGKIAAYEAQKSAGSRIDEGINSVSQNLDGLVESIKEAFAMMHFNSIADAHEDFMDIANSEEFQQWLGSMPDEQRAAAEQVVAAGRPSQVIKLLNDYKAHLAGGSAPAEESAPPVDDGLEDAIDAAGGVRGSAPVSLPQRAPVGDEDEYRAAWNAM